MPITETNHFILHIMHETYRKSILFDNSADGSPAHTPLQSKGYRRPLIAFLKIEYRFPSTTTDPISTIYHSQGQVNQEYFWGNFLTTKGTKYSKGEGIFGFSCVLSWLNKAVSARPPSRVCVILNANSDQPQNGRKGPCRVLSRDEHLLRYIARARMTKEEQDMLHT